MSIRDVCRRKEMMYAAARDTQRGIMAGNKLSENKKDEDFKLFASELGNAKVSEILNITYTEVIHLRFTYERRCKR